MSTAEVLDQTLLQIEFYDYTLQRLVPTQVELTEFIPQIIQSEGTRISYGISTNGRTHAIAKIENNTLSAVGSDNNTQVIRVLQTITLTKLTTTDKEYTKFKFLT